ncbi:acyl-homoserine-lactone synthase [Novosphingobium gossypii]|uniref:acyl-homoserine-lactone synthase n=1 Tax=Novosphingobium gossypii TaxID=1604774 RepID=UPI003D190259
MVHILSIADLDLAQRTAETKTLLAMFEARKSVFVDLLKWDVPILDGRYELDQFDDERARYVILADGTCAHRGSARLLPTTREHILGEFYAQLCDEKVPRGPDIFEITRFCLDRGLRTAARREVRDALVCALVGHALANGIRTYTAIAETSWFRQIMQFGWDCQPLGAARRMGRQELIAMQIAIDPLTPERLAARGIAVADNVVTLESAPCSGAPATAVATKPASKRVA